MGSRLRKNTRISLRAHTRHCKLCSMRCGFQPLFFCAALVLVTGLAAPSAARAECGDYVVYGNSSSAAHLSATAPVAHDRAQPSDHAPLNGSCQGPHCSGGEPLPLVPVATAPVPIEQWGCMTVIAVAVQLSSSLCNPENRRPQRLEHAQVIYHPPR